MFYDYYYIIKINNSIKILKYSDIKDVLKPITINNETTNQIIFRKIHQLHRELYCNSFDIAIREMYLNSIIFNNLKLINEKYFTYRDFIDMDIDQVCDYINHLFTIYEKFNNENKVIIKKNNSMLYKSYMETSDTYPGYENDDELEAYTYYDFNRLENGDFSGLNDYNEKYDIFFNTQFFCGNMVNINPNYSYHAIRTLFPECEYLFKKNILSSNIFSKINSIVYSTHDSSFNLQNAINSLLKDDINIIPSDNEIKTYLKNTYYYSVVRWTQDEMTTNKILYRLCNTYNILSSKKSNILSRIIPRLLREIDMIQIHRDSININRDVYNKFDKNEYYYWVFRNKTDSDFYYSNLDYKSCRNNNIDNIDNIDNINSINSINNYDLSKPILKRTDNVYINSIEYTDKNYIIKNNTYFNAYKSRDNSIDYSEKFDYPCENKYDSDNDYTSDNDNMNEDTTIKYLHNYNEYNDIYFEEKYPTPLENKYDIELQNEEFQDDNNSDYFEHLFTEEDQHLFDNPNIINNNCDDSDSFIDDLKNNDNDEDKDEDDEDKQDYKFINEREDECKDEDNEINNQNNEEKNIKENNYIELESDNDIDSDGWILY